MARHQIAWNPTTKVALAQHFGDATIAGASTVGSFYHSAPGPDALGVTHNSDALYHHVRDLLYPLGVLDMSTVKISYVPVTSISTTPATAAKTVGQTQQLTTTFTPALASNRRLLYTTSDPTKATVSSTGLITAVAAGVATITITSEDGSFVNTCVVTVS